MTEPKVAVVPSRVDGVIARVVSDGTEDWVEVWGPNGWVADTSGFPTIRDVMVAPPIVNPAVLKRIGAEMPPEG